MLLYGRVDGIMDGEQTRLEKMWWVTISSRTMTLNIHPELQ